MKYDRFLNRLKKGKKINQKRLYKVVSELDEQELKKFLSLLNFDTLGNNQESTQTIVLACAGNESFKSSFTLEDLLFIEQLDTIPEHFKDHLVLACINNNKFIDSITVDNIRKISSIVMHKRNLLDVLLTNCIANENFIKSLTKHNFSMILDVFSFIGAGEQLIARCINNPEFVNSIKSYEIEDIIRFITTREVRNLLILRCMDNPNFINDDDPYWGISKLLGFISDKQIRKDLLLKSLNNPKFINSKLFSFKGILSLINDKSIEEQLILECLNNPSVLDVLSPDDFYVIAGVINEDELSKLAIHLLSKPEFVEKMIRQRKHNVLLSIKDQEEKERIIKLLLEKPNFFHSMDAWRLQEIAESVINQEIINELVLGYLNNYGMEIYFSDILKVLPLLQDEKLKEEIILKFANLPEAIKTIYSSDIARLTSYLNSKGVINTLMMNILNQQELLSSIPIDCLRDIILSLGNDYDRDLVTEKLISNDLFIERIKPEEFRYLKDIFSQKEQINIVALKCLQNTKFVQAITPQSLLDVLSCVKDKIEQNKIISNFIHDPKFIEAVAASNLNQLIEYIENQENQDIFVSKCINNPEFIAGIDPLYLKNIVSIIKNNQDKEKVVFECIHNPKFLEQVDSYHLENIANLITNVQEREEFILRCINNPNFIPKMQPCHFKDIVRLLRENSSREEFIERCLTNDEFVYHVTTYYFDDVLGGITNQKLKEAFIIKWLDSFDGSYNFSADALEKSLPLVNNVFLQEKIIETYLESKETVVSKINNIFPYISSYELKKKYIERYFVNLNSNKRVYDIQQMCCNAIENFQESERILITKHLFEIGLISEELLKKFVFLMFRGIKNKEELLKSENFDFVYKLIQENGGPLTLLFNAYSSKLQDNEREIISQYDDSEQTKEKVKGIIRYYNTYGLIDEVVFNDVLAIAQKYNKNITMEKLMQITSQNEELRAILEDLTKLYEKPDDYKKSLEELDAIFPKARLVGMPDVHFYKALSLKQKKHFNIKAYNRLASLPIFNQNVDAKVSLVGFMEIMGLFEDDNHVSERLERAVKLATQYSDFFVLDDLESFEYFLKKEKVERNYTEDDFFESTKEILYLLKISPNMIPEEIRHVFVGKPLTHDYVAYLKKLEGSFGKKVTDFISPYAKDGEGFVLKRSVNIPEHLKSVLKERLTKEEYENLLETNPRAAAFLSPIKAQEFNGYKIKKNLTKEEQEIVDKFVVQSLITKQGAQQGVNSGIFHRIFGSSRLKYNPEFLEFLEKNFNLILSQPELQAMFTDINVSYNMIRIYFASRGNTAPSIFDYATFFEEIGFSYQYGNEEFAKLVKNSGVKDQSVYDYYEELLEKVETRKTSTIPRHEKVYEIIDESDKKEYKILTKILRCDDPMNMLVGEDNFTGCCQVYGDAGEECMEHASTSENGGILAVYLLDENGNLQLLTQSWVWTLETKLCLDNIEGSNLLKNNPTLQQLAIQAIKSAAEDMIDASEEYVENYVRKQREIILTANLTEQEKQKKLEDLEILKQRQTLRSVTVGGAWSDVAVEEVFKEKDNQGVLPKGYDGYSDARKQYIVAKSKEEPLDIDENYKDVAIYRDERVVEEFEGEKINQNIFKRISAIKGLDKHQPLVIDDEEIYSVYDIADVYDCEEQEFSVKMGEDWFVLLSENKYEVNVIDLKMGKARLDDEQDKQLEEFNNAIKSVIEQSVCDDGVVKDIVWYINDDSLGVLEELIEQKVIEVVDQDEKKQIIKFKVSEQTKNKILKQRKDSQMGENND